MTKTKRPTHKSDAMKLILSDSVAPKLVEKLVELEKQGLKGDALLASTAIALSMERDREWWDKFIDVLEFEDALLKKLEALHREGKPVSMAFLRQVQQRYAEEIKPYKPKPWEIWRGAFNVTLCEFKDEKYIIVKRYKEFEFELPVEG
jgi:hypothetical protein